MPIRRFATFAWGVLAYTILVILWGAFVRATGSGAGCGSHWPLCNGEMLHRPEQIETLIELSHRLSSGVALLVVAALVPLAWRTFARGHVVRRAAVVSLILMVVEALVGASLVLLELVAANATIARAYWMAGHLVNTFLLLAALTLTAWYAEGNGLVRLRGQPRATLLTLAAACFGLLILAASGGVTALGDTLVLRAGIRPEENAFVAMLVSLRIYHPLIAFGVGGLLLLAVWRARVTHPSRLMTRLSRVVVGLYVVQLLAGAVNVVLQAPVAMQLLHLLLSDLIWIGVILLCGAALGRVAADEPAAASTSTGSSPGRMAQRGAA